MRTGVVALSFVVALWAAGCGFRSAASQPPVDGSGDAAPDACVSFATLLPLDTCPLGFDSEIEVHSGTALYDTGAHTLTINGVSVPVAHTMITLGGNPAEVLSMRTLMLAESTRLEATGPLPLVIAVSTDAIVMAGAQIDVSDGGAGAQDTCTNGAVPGAGSAGGGAGGGGGGYGADGGRGGSGNSDGTRSVGGDKGLAIAAVPDGLRGGCPGAPGGNGYGTTIGGAAGNGGGAFYLVAGGRIELGTGAAVNAGGGAGGGGARTVTSGDAGGGGGGSGGMLLLEAPHIVGGQATIAANGGGGGGGADNGTGGGDGTPGSVSAARAAGGNGTVSINGGNGTDGGRGGSKDVPAGEDVTTVRAGGGGGGGGGVGIIRIKSAELQALTISPDPR